MQVDIAMEDRLESIVRLCTETIERAEHYDAEHALVLGLQDRLLGELPPLPGVRTSVCSLPLVRAPSVGGDWYEGLTLTDSRIAIIVGDMCGHGVGAAADMASIRGMISALLHAGIPVSRVFREVTDVLGQREGMLLATAALAVFDVADATVTFATAGHPPPLLRFPDGRVHRLSTANGPLIGGPVSHPFADTAPFPRGSQLVMYTDGLVERRTQPFNVGVDRAARHLAALPRLHNEELIGSLLDELVGAAEPEDDIAIIVIEHTGI
jgi:serine phosphatase RsbU (regulator of sigma subunit)